MAGDMMAARGQASGGRTFFGHNSHRPPGEGQQLVHLPGRVFPPGESVQVQQSRLAQARQTFTVLGSQPAGCWGLQHGLNEHRVAVGCSSWSSRLACSRPELSGLDLTRLALERGRSAGQAVDVLTDLISRHGQGRPEVGSEEVDSVFLVADPHAAFAVEAASRAWVVQEIHETRAAGDVAIIRQDWSRIAPGLAADVIERGWHQADGSKLDFAGSLSVSPVGQESALRRWGRATFLLEQESGRIDLGFLRRLLGDHYEGTHFQADPVRGSSETVPLCRHAGGRGQLTTAASLAAELSAEPDALALAWCTFGPPCVAVYFPIFVEAELPAALAAREPRRWQQRLYDRLGRDPSRWQTARQRLAQLQSRFDQEAAEFVVETGTLLQEGQREQVRRLAGLLVQGHCERFADAVRELLAGLDRAPAAHAPGAAG
jgi:secernin